MNPITRTEATGNQGSIVGQYATVYRYSDSEVYLVIAATDRTLTLQYCKAVLLNGANSGEPDALQFAPGGFCGHTSGTQRWSIAPDPNGSIVKARLRRNGQFRTSGKSGSLVKVGVATPHYDFNF